MKNSTFTFINLFYYLLITYNLLHLNKKNPFPFISSFLGDCNLKFAKQSVSIKNAFNQKNMKEIDALIIIQI